MPTETLPPTPAPVVVRGPADVVTDDVLHDDLQRLHAENARLRRQLAERAVSR